jgi:hypothetical protein
MVRAPDGRDVFSRVLIRTGEFPGGPTAHASSRFSEQTTTQVFDYLVGGLDFFRLNETDVVAAHLFFYIFIFVMIFIVLNITIAIIMDGYAIMQERR